MLPVEVVAIQHLFLRNYLRKVVEIATGSPRLLEPMRQRISFAGRGLGDRCMSAIVVAFLVVMSQPLFSRRDL